MKNKKRISHETYRNNLLRSEGKRCFPLAPASKNTVFTENTRKQHKTLLSRREIPLHELKWVVIFFPFILLCRIASGFVSLYCADFNEEA